MKNILVTGYRAHELGISNQKHQGITYIKKAIAAQLIPLIEDGLAWVITPGQYGVDLWACEVGLELKKQYPHLKVAILAAYSNPEAKWKEDKQNYYRQIVQTVDYYGLVSKEPYSGIWQLRARDDLLFKKTDGMLLFYDEEAGEASPRYFKERALKLQQQTGYRLLTIQAEDIQNIADDEQMNQYEQG
ncbi:MAG: DUF1273 domain-containing protein [Gorillibacterium sp.]|nr:DUF1273 domain-containing protein [Gorillibacterium sp.]